MTKEKTNKSSTIETEDKTTASIVMTGVSGKKIMADVKVVKVKKKEKAAKDETTVQGASEKQGELATASLNAKEKVSGLSKDKDSLLAKTAQIAKKASLDKEAKAKPESTTGKQEKKEKATKQGEIGTEKSTSSPTSKQEKQEATKGVESIVVVENSAKSQENSVKSQENSALPTIEKNQESKSVGEKTSKDSSLVASSVFAEDKVSMTEHKISEEKDIASKSATTNSEESNESSKKPVNSSNSLAATVARFAAQAAAKKEAMEKKKQNQGGKGRFGGRERDFTQGANKRNGQASDKPARHNANSQDKERLGKENYSRNPKSDKKFGNQSYGGGFNPLAKDKDEEQKPFTHSKKQSTKKSDFNSEIISHTSKDLRQTAFAHADKYKKSNQNKDKDTNQKSFVVGKEASRNIKKKAQDFTRGASGEDEVLDAVFRARKGKTSKGKLVKQEQGPVIREVLTNISLPAVITVKEFAEAIKKTSAEVIKNLMKYGVMATLNQEIDFDTAALLASEFGITAEQLIEVTEEDILFDDSEDILENLIQRPPVVCVMGHVDHGKTSLLDSIRKTSVVAGEAGGITQHIGAYMVDLNGRKITFLDTPGHEAFTTMRARGAQTTDIAILVVAADDGVMPQTVESINHAKAAGTQIIVAINKIDRPGANIERVKQELAQHEILAEDWGGNITMVPVSAKTGENIEELLEMVLLTADIMDLKADPKRQAKGTVIEAKLDKQRGPVATLLVQRGTLFDGDTVVTGQIVGRIRAMSDSSGIATKEAQPSVPVEVLGLPEVPEAGDIFYAVKDEKVARQLAEKRRIKNREENIGRSSKMTLENLFSKMKEGEVKELNLIVKADVVGSVEAVRASLERLSNEEVRVRVVHGGVGAVTESDVRLAEVTNAIIIGFNVRPATNVSELAKDAQVDMRLYRIIYNAIEDVESAMKGMLSPTYKEVELGKLEIRQVFRASNIGVIGGSYVLNGKIVRNCEVRLVREGIVVWEGHLASLKRFKDDVREVAAGYECGISLENYQDIKEGDIVECFTMEEVKRS